MLYKLESLRGIAACFIVLVHSRFNFYGSPVIFIKNSYLFVDLFFVLSGFVMSLAYEARIKTGLSFKSYIVARLGRLYPMHLIVLISWVPYILIKQYLFESGYGGTDQFEFNNIQSFFSNLLLVHSMGILEYASWNYPSWSISTEFFAYIFFYACSVFFDKKKSLFMPLLISFVSYGIIINLHRPSLEIIYDYGFFRCVGAFYLGVFLFRFHSYVKFKEIISKHIVVMEIASIILVGTSVFIAEVHPLYFLFALFSFVITIYVFSLHSSGFIGLLLLNSLFRKIGLWSYSIYMIHAIVLAGVSNIFEFMFEYDFKSALGFKSIVINFTVLVIIILCSSLTYTYIEKYFRTLSRDISKKYNVYES